MNRRLVLVTLLLPLVLCAQEPIPSAPAQILSESRADLAGLMRATSGLKRFIPKMRSKEEIYPYLQMLPELEKIAANYDTATLGVDPARELSLLLTRDAVRWIELDRDSAEIVAIFLARAENNTRYTMASQQVKRLNPVDDKDKLLVWHQAIDRALKQVMAIPAEVDVIEKFEELQGKTVAKLLPHAKAMTPEQITTLFSNLRGETALEEVLDYLYDRALEADSKEESDRIVAWALELGKTVRAQGGKLRSEMKVYPGRILLQLLANQLGRREVPGHDIGLFIDSLVSSQLAELGDLLVRLFDHKDIPDRHVEFLWDLSSKLVQRLTERKMHRNLVEFEPFHKKLATAHAALEGRFEGTYRVTIGEGGKLQKAILTIASVGASNFIMALNVDYGSDRPGEGLVYNFFNVLYDFENKQYVGQYRAIEDPRFLHRTEEHQHIIFKLTRQPAGLYRVEGKVLTGAVPFHKPFSGEQYEVYPTYSPIAVPPVRDFTGTFVEYDAAGKAQSWLVMTKTGTSAGGILRFLGTASVWIPFEWGYFNPHRNAFYLSSGELQSQKWVTVRGQFAEDGKSLKLTRISGGVGLKQLNTVYHRVE